MSDIDKLLKNVVDSLEEIKDNEVKILLIVIFLSKCGMNKDQIIEKILELDL